MQNGGAAMREDGAIDYVELPGMKLSEIKRFYAAAFGWRFLDYGPTYVAVEGAGVDAGFQGDPAEAPEKPLVILYAKNLEAMRDEVVAAGGEITRPIFPFPGGRRFHFRDPAGNELAVWSDAGVSGGSAA
jgi:predicted enzyme related to lactoylglutathione lyase